MELIEFARAWIPPPPGPIGVDGSEDLSERLRERGYEVSARPPLAAVVADGLPASPGDAGDLIDEIASDLVTRGVFVLEGLAWDLLEGPTAEWLYAQMRMLAAAGRLESAPESLSQLLDSWREQHAGQPRFEELRVALAERFEERELVMVAGLYRPLGGPASRMLEQTLIDTEMIRPLGFLYAGARR